MASLEIMLHCSRTERMDRQAGKPDQPRTGEAKLWLASIAELRAASDRYKALLDPDERIRAERFRFEADRERFVLGHGFLRETLAAAMGIAPSEIRYGRSTHGKPFIEGHSARFNFSDTKDAVLVGFTERADLGIDLETMTRRVDHDAVAGHYFTEEEVVALQVLDGPARKRRFLELWTRKEAVLKASGVGIMEDLKEMRVEDGSNSMRASHPEFVSMAASAYHVRTFLIGDAHIVSLAAPVPLDAIWLR
ncbi:MAG: 4'-phosphopantetheinyl transferase superfamily protein [Flavobacteriales bacterium]|nr:4'-phosphopantetheinyl transferase superfamily protein [Flavobacteriales bacterium]